MSQVSLQDWVRERMLVNYIIIIYNTKQSSTSPKQTNNKTPNDYLQENGFNKKVLIVCHCLLLSDGFTILELTFSVVWSCLKWESDSRAGNDHWQTDWLSYLPEWLLAWCFCISNSAGPDGCKSHNCPRSG